MDKDLWVKNILDAVWVFSSEEFQQRSWIEGKGTEVSSFTEADCQFFDDNLADQLIDVEWHNIGITETQKNKLAAFRDALREFNQLTKPFPKSHTDILGNSRWPEIRTLAKEALDSFKGSKWELPRPA